jgi:hypothetical protein
MSHTKFKVGDRVEYIGDMDRIKMGYKGTIVHFWNTENDTVLDIEWDKNVNGHGCEGKARAGHGWNVYASCVKLAVPDITLSTADAKYADVIRKTKELTKRFEDRKKGIDYVHAA